MLYRSDPEMIFIKWAYKKGELDDDDLYDFNMRYKAESPEMGRLEALVAWELMDQARIDALLRPEAIERGLRDGLIDDANAASLRELINEC